MSATAPGGDDWKARRAELVAHFKLEEERLHESIVRLRREARQLQAEHARLWEAWWACGNRSDLDRAAEVKAEATTMHDLAHRLERFTLPEIQRKIRLTAGSNSPAMKAVRLVRLGCLPE